MPSPLVHRLWEGSPQQQGEQQQAAQHGAH